MVEDMLRLSLTLCTDCFENSFYAGLKTHMCCVGHGPKEIGKAGGFSEGDKLPNMIVSIQNSRHRIPPWLEHPHNARYPAQVSPGHNHNLRQKRDRGVN